MHRWFVPGFLFLAAPVLAQAQALDRDTKVRNDRKLFESSKEWIYNNLEQGIQAAKAASKPILVVFRCIPCEACQEFDDDVARRDPIIRDLLDEFVCVRIVQANTIDLSRFQHDFDQSFAAYMINPDGTIYGRFGTRSARPEEEDISLQGFRKAMEGALAMHRNYAAVKPTLAHKQVEPSRYRTPRDYPSLGGKYEATLDYEGRVAKSCMHCHQIREAERLVFRTAGDPIPDRVLFPYPDPELLGLKLNPDEKARVERVFPGSPASRAGIQVGDDIESLDGQPLLSIADIQWVLQNLPATAELAVVVRRQSHPIDLKLVLAEGWRRGDISWRATTWDLRRMAFGGMRLDEIRDDDRVAAKLERDELALRVRHVGQFGNHAIARNAGFQKDDIVIAFDGLSRRMSESELLAYALQKKRPGDEVEVIVLRDGARKTLTLPLQ